MRKSRLSNDEKRRIKLERRQQRRQYRRMLTGRPTQCDDTLQNDLGIEAYPRTSAAGSGRATFKAMNAAQARFAALIRSHKVAIATGAAGTGKSYVGLSLACDALLQGEIDRLIVVRPLVQTEDSQVGTLPGHLDDKIRPYFTPALDILNDRLGAAQVKALTAAKRIELLPLAFMRGSTFHDCWIVLDEAQNTTPAQMRMLLTRIGHNCKLIINGDGRQCDLPEGQRNGLEDVISRFRYSEFVGVHRFLQADIVRDDFVREVVLAYEGSDGSLAQGLAKVTRLQSRARP